MHASNTKHSAYDDPSRGNRKDSGRRSSQSSGSRATRYKVRRHAVGTTVSDVAKGGQNKAVDNSRQNARRRHHRDGDNNHHTGNEEGRRRKNGQKPLIGRLAVSGGAGGRAALMEQKRKLYKDTSQQPLWGVRKLTINPIDKDDLRRFPGNGVYTTRYTISTFMPRALWEQFHRVSNWWLLFVLILESVPGLHSKFLHPWSVGIPLAATLLLSVFKDTFLDLQRAANDRRLNQRLCCIVDGRTPQLRTVHWKSLRVGNILRLTDDEEVPADVVVLGTSNPEGVAYVETSRLDGETALKFKQGVKETRTETSPLSIVSIRGRVVCEKPSGLMDSFSGSLKLDAHPRATSLDITNFVQRGAHIRNTEWLYGVVVYTGKDTRIHRSACRRQKKVPHMEREINTYTTVTFFLVFLFILVSVMSESSLQDREGEATDSGTAEFPSSVAFLLASRDNMQNPWVSILRYMALFVALVPVSLPLVLDFAYIFQSLLIQGDVLMRAGVKQPPLGSNNSSSSGTEPNHRHHGADDIYGSDTFFKIHGTLSSTGSNSQFPFSPLGSKPDTSRMNSFNSRGQTPSVITRTSSGGLNEGGGWPTVQTPNIMPNLGQVDFVFMDKTGTITGNDMTFSMCSVAGRIYGLTDCRDSFIGDDDDFEDSIGAHGGSDFGNSGHRKRIDGNSYTNSERQRVSLHSFSKTSLASSTKGPSPDGDVFLSGDLSFDISGDKENSRGPNATFSGVADHSMAKNRLLFDRDCDASGDDARPSNKQQNTGDKNKKHLEMTPLNCIRSLSDNSPRRQRHRHKPKEEEEKGWDRSPPDIVTTLPASQFTFSSKVNDDDERKKQITFAEVENPDQQFFAGEDDDDGSEESYGNDDQEEDPAETEQRENLRFVPFLYDDVELPSLFRDSPADGQIRRNCDFYDGRIFDDLGLHNMRSHKVNEFLKCMALCNTVVPYLTNLQHAVGGVSSSLLQSWGGTGVTSHMAQQQTNITVSPTCRATTTQSVATYNTRVGGRGNNLRYEPSRISTRGLGHSTKMGSMDSIAGHRKSGSGSTELINGTATSNEEAPLKQESIEDAGTPRGSSHYRSPKRVKSLGRGVSFKDTHEEYSFEKGKEDIASDGNGRMLVKLSSHLSTKCSRDFDNMVRLNSRKFNRHGEEDIDSGMSRQSRSATNVHYSNSWEQVRSVKYQASSPDEECLVSAASHMGYTLVSRSSTNVILEINEQLRNWQVIGVNEFTSKRGRMSIVLRPEGWKEGAVMYVKGADFSMLNLLTHFDGMEKTRHFHDFAFDGGKCDYAGDEAEAYAQNMGNIKSPQSSANETFAFNNSAVNDTMASGGSPAGPKKLLHCRTGAMGYSTLVETYKQKRHRRSRDTFASTSDAADPEAIQIVEEHLKAFSLQGLRSMVLACRYLTQDELDAYQRLYNDAYASVYSREERLEKVAEQFERDLEYLGITGVRDKLQSYVPDTLELMMEAGIRIWMVTGDDVEYALHICHSCHLLTSNTKIFHAALGGSRGKRAKREGVLLYEMFRKARKMKKADEHICLVVTGHNLSTFLNHPDLQTYFLNMACCCDVVVAARVTPTQKAEMVRLVKRRLTPEPITLAVGDGGNDVAMLQEAHIGIAIRTRRGTSIAGFADFALSEFRFLQRLLFVHGRLNFMRISKVILWTFFKSIIFTMPIFLFQPSAFWSAVSIFDPFMYLIANFVWTTVPAIIYSYSEQDLPDHLLPSIPVLYTLGRRRLYFNGIAFSFWTIEGIIHSIFTYYLLQAAWMDSNTTSNGQELTFFSFGVILLSGAVVQSNLRILMETHLRTPTFLLMTVWLCSVGIVPFVFLYSVIGWPSSRLIGVAKPIFMWPLLYFVVPMWVGVGIVLQALITGLKGSILPNISTHVKLWLAQRQSDYDKRKLLAGIPMEQPRVRFLPGGQYDNGRLCGMSKTWDNIKRALWVYGGGACVPAPGILHNIIDRDMLTYLRENFNPLRHREVSEKLPPPRRFRINENFIVYGAEDNRAMGGADLRPGQVRNVLMLSPSGQDMQSQDSISTDASWEMEKGQDDTTLVKVSHLINRFTLKFKDMQLEADYQIHQKKSFIKRLVPWYRVIFVFLGLYRMLTFLSDFFIDVRWNNAELTGWVCIPTVVLEVVLIGAVASTFYNFFMDHFTVVLSAVVVTMISEHVAFYSSVHSDGILSSVLFPVFTFVILRISFLQAVMWNCLFLTLFITRFAVDDSIDIASLYVHLPLFLGSVVFVGFVGYRMEYNQRKSFLLDYSVEASRRKQREILNTMLPPFVVDQMINAPINEDGIPTGLDAEDRGTVSVVFCDVYEFQQVVASIEPTRLVEVLDSLFLCFDKSAEQFGCTKIETVFETYLAAAGLLPGRSNDPDASRQDACDAMDMALAMLEVAAQIRYEVTREADVGTEEKPKDNNNPQSQSSIKRNMARQKTASLRPVLMARPQRIRVKIGINSGRVISGVVGAKKPQYALFGDTVNTASRMKTTGLPDYIHISESTHDLVKDDTTLIYDARKTAVKGKGDMNTYLLVKVLGSPYPNFGDGDERVMSNGLEPTQTITEHDIVNQVGGEDEINDNSTPFVSDPLHCQEPPPWVAQATEPMSSSPEEASNGDYMRTPSSVNYFNAFSALSSSSLNSGNLIGPQASHQFIEIGTPGMSYQNLRKLVTRQQGLSRVMAFARDGIGSADVSNMPRQEITKQTQACFIREQMLAHEGASGNAIMSGENLANADDLKFTSTIPHSTTINKLTKSLTESPTSMEAKSKDIGYTRRLQQASVKLHHIGEQAQNKIASIMSAIIPTWHSSTQASSRDDHGVTLGQVQDDDDYQEMRATKVTVTREWLLLKFKDKNFEARYRTHFYNNKANINTIEQAIIIFLITFTVQTLVRLLLPRIYDEPAVEVSEGLSTWTQLYWCIRAAYTCVSFLLWLLFHYRNRVEIASRLDIRWMVFLLNVLFISAACVFALSNSWSVPDTLTPSMARGFTNKRGSCWEAPSIPFALADQYDSAEEMAHNRTITYLSGPVVAGTSEDAAECLVSDDSPTPVIAKKGIALWLTSDTVELFFYLVILHHNTGLLFQNCVLVDVLLLLTCISFILTAAQETATTVGTIINFPCYMFFNLVSAYCKEYIDRLTFYVNEHAKTTEGRATQLLNDMLPKQVLEEFQQDKLRLAYTHDRVTFLFADICGFTSWAKNVDACEVVTMLQKLFAKFDRDSTKYKLYKLCTIGDAYVAVTEPVTEDNQDYDPVEGTSLALAMAKSMIANIYEVRDRLNIPSLNMRIGLHYGQCVGGVIGSGRLRYDLWGMDVLTGNMMESNGQPGKVCVSEPLREFLTLHFPGRFTFKFNKTVWVINKSVDSYLVFDAGEAEEEIMAIVSHSTMRRDDTSTPQKGKFKRRFTVLGMSARPARRHSIRTSHEDDSMDGDEGCAQSRKFEGYKSRDAHSFLHDQDDNQSEEDGLERLRKEVDIATMKAAEKSLERETSSFRAQLLSPQSNK